MGQVKAAALAALRVFTATVLAAWLQAGTPVRGLTPNVLLDWVELGLTAAVGLVLANYLGGWETRYGRGADKT